MELFVVLDNLRSALNVGAIFRTADALAVRTIFLCGTTPRPGQNGRAGKDLAKTALGAERAVPWQYFKRTADAVRSLKKQGIAIVALEQDARAVSIERFKPPKRCALIMGNEVSGIARRTLARCDTIVYIPMRGCKESLNVSVAFGVAGYLLNRNTKRHG